MAKYNYSTQLNTEHTARAVGRDLSISTKDSIEICREIRRKTVAQARNMLTRAILKEKAIPFKRYNADRGHKKGHIAAGRFPIKSCKAIMGLIDSVTKNAENKGLDTENLSIVHTNAHKASSPMHFGRHSGREMKRTHVELIVEQTEPKKEKAKNKKAAVKIEPKAEEKIEAKKEEPKPVTQTNQTPKASETKVKTQAKEEIQTNKKSTEKTNQEESKE